MCAVCAQLGTVQVRSVHYTYPTAMRIYCPSTPLITCNKSVNSTRICCSCVSALMENNGGGCVGFWRDAIGKNPVDYMYIYIIIILLYLCWCLYIMYALYILMSNKLLCIYRYKVHIIKCIVYMRLPQLYYSTFDQQGLAGSGHCKTVILIY